MTSNLYNPAMQAALSDTVAMKVMPVGQPVSAMATVDEPYLSDVKNRSQDHVQGQTALEVTEEDHSLGRMERHQPDHMIKAP